MRIAIVNDMATAVEVIRRALNGSPHTIAWTARSGDEAVQCAQQDSPDLILMDMLMPGMNGVRATREIMRSSPCAILIVTASIRSNSSLVFEAIGAGALDVVRTPVLGGSNPGESAVTLLRKIARIENLLGNGVAEPATLPAPVVPGPATNGGTTAPLIGVGASAGGPGALSILLGALPAGFPGCIVVVQHLDLLFVPSFVRWLGSQTALTVRAVRAGDRPVSGTVLVAHTPDHVVLARDGSLQFSVEPRDIVYRPSVDVFFRSAARNPPPDSTFVLLTGMRRDGAQGLLELRHAGCRTIAQDQFSSAVFGMPRAAIELGAAQQVLSIHDMPRALCEAYSVPFVARG